MGVCQAANRGAADGFVLTMASATGDKDAGRGGTFRERFASSPFFGILDSSSWLGRLVEGSICTANAGAFWCLALSKISSKQVAKIMTEGIQIRFLMVQAGSE